MSKTKKSWVEIKAGKTAEEWHRINKIYDRRRRLKKQLQQQGTKLLIQIHNSRLVESPGPADVLTDEVRQALHLRYGWDDEDYDHAVARLDDIRANLKKIRKKLTPKSSELANTLMMIVLNSKDEEGVKAAALVNTAQYVANKLSTERVTGLEQSKTNYVMTLLRTEDRYYPDWFPRYLFDNFTRVLRTEDIRQLSGMLTAFLSTLDNKAKILGMISMDEEEEVVIG